MFDVCNIHTVKLLHRESTVKVKLFQNIPWYCIVRLSECVPSDIENDSIEAINKLLPVGCRYTSQTQNMKQQHEWV